MFGDVYRVPQLRIISGWVDVSQTPGRLCVQSVRDATLERYCCNVNNRAVGSTMFTSDLFLRTKKDFKQHQTDATRKTTPMIPLS